MKNNIKITEEIAIELKNMWEQGSPSREIQLKLGLKAATISQHVRRNALSRPLTVSARTNLIIKDGLYQCNYCKVFKSPSEYQINSCGYLIGTCRDCRSQQEYSRRVKSVDVWLSTKLSKYKHSSLKQNIGYDLDADYVRVLYGKQCQKCFYSDVHLNFGHSTSIRYGMSIDKVIPERGYVKGNVVLAQTRINSAKSDFSLDEMKLWMPEWYRRIVECDWLNI